MVVSHDDTLGRMCGHQYKENRVSDFDYADMPRYQNKVSMHMTQGDYNLRDDEDGRMPLLRELFEAFPNTLISIDIKEKDEILVQKVNDMIVEFSRENKTVWGSMFKEQHLIA